MIAGFQHQAEGLLGNIDVPGDKSLSHRAVLFAAMAEGTSRLNGVLDSADVRATIGAVSALGATVELTKVQDGSLEGTVTGWGTAGPRSPQAPIDCGNSGTTTRLLLGVLAGYPGLEATLVGDESLSKRPMRRVTEPLSAMGARFETTDAGTLPVTVRGAELAAIDYASPVASAQVKTAVLLAALRATGATRVSEPSLSRDHTERLLPAFGVPVTTDPAPGATVVGPTVLTACNVAVPRDPSSAVFPAVAAAIVRGSSISVPGVALNLTRIGFLSVLERMGVSITVTDASQLGSEPVGTIRVSWAPDLRATTVTAGEVPSLVDEVPVLALAASQAAGTTRFEGIGELRVKESDRLAAIVDGLTQLGVTVRSGEDWLEVDGPARLGGAWLESGGDHRLAMTWALAGLVARDEVYAREFGCVAVSWPEFAYDMAAIGTTLVQLIEDTDPEGI